MKLDVDFVRRQFPAFADAQARQWAFFENGGGSYACGPVVERLHRFMTEHKVQPYGPFALSERAGAAMDEGYAAIAAWLGTPVDQITLGPSTTANAYVLARALAPRLGAGEEIVVTNQDHEANIGAWRRLAEQGLEIREWQVDETGELELAELERLVGPRTRLVCCSLCSNLTGSINPLAEIVAIAHRHGALVVGDGVSFAPHLPLAVEESGLDFYLFSTYKTFGTHLGVLWGSPEALAHTSNQSHYFNADKPRSRLNPAGPQHAEIAALGGLSTYFDDVYDHHFSAPEPDFGRRAAAVWGLIREHETRLTERLLAGIERLPGLRLVGHGRQALARRVGVVSLVPERLPASLLATRLGARDIAVRNGDFYAVRLIEALGIDPDEGVLRCSLVHYNTLDEVDRLLDGLDQLAR